MAKFVQDEKDTKCMTQHWAYFVVAHRTVLQRLFVLMFGYPCVAYRRIVEWIFCMDRFQNACMKYNQDEVSISKHHWI